VILNICSLLLLVLALACGGEAAAGAKPGQRGGGKPGGGPAMRGPIEFPVELAQVTAQDVQYTISAVGSVEAYEKVQVTARVAGVVERVRFTEGEHVKQGQILAEIEPRRFEVAVRAARAALSRVAASKAEAAAGLARREAAVAQSPGLVRAEELESWRTKMELAAAEEMQAQATLDQAALNLRDAMVRAPTAGTIETRNVQTGQYAQPGTVLTTLVKRDPLLLRFTVPESDASRLSTGMTVSFVVRGGEGSYSAKVTHVSQLAETSSRMVTVTAEIDPAQRDALRPGAFAEVTFSVGTSTRAPVVPQAAVRPSEKGFVAFVVQGGIAKERIVTLGLHTRDGRVEVRSGLAVGEQLVVRGAEALRDGAKVKLEGSRR
jgi:multidrug efflux system membrane fusion protein